MRQSRKFLPLGVALALCAATGLTLSPAHAAKSSPAKTASATRSSKSANALHQFTGYVTALDKTSLTVEKRGKQPRTVVFTRHDEMRTIGELEKNARVTVYYRDEGGKTIAHRVVVKREGGTSKG